MGKLLSFPDPVNETAARTVATGVVAMSVTAVAGDQPWLMLPLAYGFAARVATGPKLSPLGRLATQVVAPRIPGDPKLSPGPPKRFAQVIGLVFSTSAVLLHYRFRRPRAAKVVLTALAGAATLEAAFGLCLGCKLFQLGMRLGIVPAQTCERCNDIWSQAAAPSGDTPAPAAPTGPVPVGEVPVVATPAATVPAV